MRIGFWHPLQALALQIALGYLTGNYWYGLVASLYFVGREIAQAEYRYIERYGMGLRANMPWWGGLSPKVWDLHSVTDVLLPLLATGIVAAIRCLKVAGV